jgi:phage shock protein A
MESELRKIRLCLAEVLAVQKRIEEDKDVTMKAATTWYNRAQFALLKGDEELARKALQMRQSQIELSEDLDSQISKQDYVVRRLLSSKNILETKLSLTIRQKESLLTRARIANNAIKLNNEINSYKYLSSSSSPSTTAAKSLCFLKERVEDLEFEADVVTCVSTNFPNSYLALSLDEKFKELERTAAIDDELEKIRRQQFLK